MDYFAYPAKSGEIFFSCPNRLSSSELISQYNFMGGVYIFFPAA
jgi:hypothetical protein